MELLSKGKAMTAKDTEQLQKQLVEAGAVVIGDTLTIMTGVLAEFIEALIDQTATTRCIEELEAAYKVDDTYWHDDRPTDPQDVSDYLTDRIAQLKGGKS